MLEKELDRKEEKTIYYKRFVDDSIYMIEGTRAATGPQGQGGPQPPTREEQE